MKTKIYIASPFFNEKQLKQVKEIEQHLAMHKIDFYSPRREGILNDMTDEERENKNRHIFMSNVMAMDSCTHVVANISKNEKGARDSGTLFEVGYFCCAKKPIILFCDDIKEMSVMLAESARSVTSATNMISDCLKGVYNEKPLIGKMN